MNITMEKLMPDDLQAIQKLAEISEDNLFTFTAKFIDDSPTANGRVWSKEWQAKNVNNFIGIPCLVNHENDNSLVVGRVFHAEQKDNAIYGKVYVPLSTEIGREAKAKIDAGLFKSVSINASASNTKTEGNLTRILPGENDRVFEVSFVAIPGCKSCEIVREDAPTKQCKGHCKCKSKNIGESSEANEWTEYARMVHNDALTTFVRLAGLAVGEGFSKDTYSNAAKRLDPTTLKTLSEDMRRICERSKVEAEVGNSAASHIKETLNNIKKVRGI